MKQRIKSVIWKIRKQRIPNDNSKKKRKKQSIMEVQEKEEKKKLKTYLKK